MRAALQCWRLGLFGRGLPLVVQGLAPMEARAGPESLAAAEAWGPVALCISGRVGPEEAERRLAGSLRRREATADRRESSVAVPLGRTSDILTLPGRPAEARACQARGNGTMAARSRRSERAAREAEERKAEEDKAAAEPEAAGVGDTLNVVV